LALSFYVPALLGLKFLPFVLFSFIFTDIIIGFHNTIFFTWGSVLIIGMLSKYIYGSTFKRLCGACVSALMFFIITNFGVLVTGHHGYNISSLLTSYTLAIPFFYNTLISTIFYSLLIEGILKCRPLIKKY
jgi:branched-subunit amino acid ABC-type transport system permease component